MTREQILSSVWGYDFEGDIRTIGTHIKTLRAKLADCGDYIKNSKVKLNVYLKSVDQVIGLKDARHAALQNNA